MADLHALLEHLRRGEMPGLARDEVDALVTWLCGATDRERDSGENPLPSPGHDPVLLQMVFYRLDATLFHGSDLNLTAAGLDSSQPEKLRKVRFRRLAGAFHPDRYPELSDWLTARSQIVLQAYGRFKHPRGEVPTDDPAPAWTDDRQAPSDMRPRGRPRRSKRRLRGLMLRLRRRFGHDPYLAHKLVGGLAVISLLPVLNLLLAPGKDTVDGGEATIDRGEATVDGLRFTLYGERPGAESQAQTLSGFRFPFSGEKPGAGTDVGAIADRDLSVPEAAPTGESVTGTERSRSDTAPTAGSGIEQATSAGAGSDRDRSAPETHPTAQPNAKSEEWDLATVAENGKRKTENDALSDPEITPLLAAARRAMNPNGHPTPVGTMPSVDEQLAAMGLESDTERLYRRMGDSDAVADGGEEESVDGGEATVDGLRLTIDGKNREEAGGLADAVGASRAGEGEEETFSVFGFPFSGEKPGAESQAQMLSVFRFPFSGEKTGAAVEGGGNSVPGGNDDGVEIETSAVPGTWDDAGVGAVSGRDRSAPETPPTAEPSAESEESDVATVAENGKPKTESAGSPIESRAGQAPTPVASIGDESVGAVSGRDRSAPETPSTTKPDAESEESDVATVAENGKRKTESAGSPIESRAGQAPTPVASIGDESVGAVSGRDRSAPETPSTTKPDAESEESDVATVAENGKPKTENATSAGDDRSPETRITATEAETANPEAPARKPSSVNRKPAPPALEPGKLVLGPMASSPPGKLLARLKKDLEQGNLVGVMGRFSLRARHGKLRGLNEIAAHYRTLFDRLAPRQVDLSARRIARDGEGWRVEAVMAIRGYGRRDRALETALDGRIVIQLDERNGRLQITRLEP